MAEKSAESTVGNYLGAPIGGAFTALATWAMAGSTGAISPALVSLLSVAGGICGLALTLLYRRYLGILGANRRAAAERQAYDALRNSLVEGNLAARLYAERLTGFLDWIDHFFGDAGMTGRTLFPRAFGLRTPAPLWTAPAFDRCLRLALFYPILTIFVIWAVAGHVGPAERVLLLEPNLTGVQRSLALAFIGFSIFVWRYYKLTISRTLAVSVAFGLCVAVAGFTAGPGSFGVVVAGAGLTAGVPLVGSGLAIGTLCGAFAVLVGLGIAPVAGPVIAVAVTIAVVAAGVTVVLLMMKSIEHRLYGVFLSLFLPAMILACLAAAGLMSPLRDWKLSGPMLLFLGLLTLLNAPFDWASLGLTRALLRRGLELGGWWPYALAIADAAFAAVIIAALALTMVVGVQAFDTLAVHGGGKPVLPLDTLLNGIASHPSLPEYWWLYALLLSSMIPSLVNLVIGGTSLLRGLPGLPSLLLRKIPTQGNVPKFDRAWIATVLTAQVAAGTALGIAAQATLG